MTGASNLTSTARLETFSDGVFAIAITLLVLEIRVPSTEATAQGRALLQALRELWPSYLGYLISFVTLGIMWANHHNMFRYVRRTDFHFLLINVVFLMCISFLPFPTALLAEYLPVPAGRQAATAFYSAVLFVIALGFNAVWRYAAWGDRLLDPAASREAVDTISRRYLVGPSAYAVAFGLAFVNVWASLAVHGILAALFLVPEHRGWLSSGAS
jgi:uncharacterized membrane protein